MDAIVENDITIRHKQERKELQSHIQMLKKSVCKGNKKRKKEVLEEILKLETDLNKKHEEETENLRLSFADCTINNSSNEENEVIQISDEVMEGSSIRLSKAQKRRDKKAQKERELNHRIIAEEALNINGKRNVEIQTIENMLKKRNLVIHEIPSDGHCLYNAIAHQLKVVDIGPYLNNQELRHKTAVYLRENEKDFLPFIPNTDSDEMLTPEQYEKYCENVASTCTWGGAIELQVLAHILQCPIEVIQAQGIPYVVCDKEYESTRMLTITYHRHMYELGAHYNSVQKCLKQDDKSDFEL